MMIRIEAIFIHGVPASAVVYEQKRATQTPKMRGLLVEPFTTLEGNVDVPPGRTLRDERGLDPRVRGVQPVVRFRWSGGVGQAAWMGGEVVVGLEYGVEMNCDVPLRVDADG